MCASASTASEELLLSLNAGEESALSQMMAFDEERVFAVNNYYGLEHGEPSMISRAACSSCEDEDENAGRGSYLSQASRSMSLVLPKGRKTLLSSLRKSQQVKASPRKSQQVKASPRKSQVQASKLARESQQAAPQSAQSARSTPEEEERKTAFDEAIGTHRV